MHVYGLNSQLLTVVHNAVSDRYEQLWLHTNAGNIGSGTVKNSRDERVDKSPQTQKESHFIGHNSLVQSILMDDLLDLCHFERALVKMDIEGSEAKALRFASKLFDSVDIPAIDMEWESLRKQHQKNSDWEWAGKQLTPPEWVRAWMQNRGYKAYPTLDHKTPLGGNYGFWPWNIVWKRK